MQTCVYANASLRLRADRPKKFCKLSFTRKKFCKFAFTPKSGRIMRALVVTGRKTIFQYSALTIYYTTIDGHSPFLPAHSSRAVVEGTPWTRRITTTSARSRGGSGRPGRAGSPPPAPAAVEEVAALDAPGSAPPHARQGRKKEGTTDAPGSPAPAAEMEEMPLTFWITPSASTARGRHRVFSNPIYSLADFFTKIRIGGRAHRKGLLPGYREAAHLGRL